MPGCKTSIDKYQNNLHQNRPRHQLSWPGFQLKDTHTHNDSITPASQDRAQETQILDVYNKIPAESVFRFICEWILESG